ncbi:MAG TPA: hypothetical protein VEA69_17045 [Tepidisphaeraceae bacterium]|nr:hypothetical protein [Tepidisphaeraceae bacterium]
MIQIVLLVVGVVAIVSGALELSRKKQGSGIGQIVIGLAVIGFALLILPRL